ncbi:hypothetical protein [Streptomyces sp. NPDC006552]|uniref:hypothetical protein n=1 Tax=Streptomyces sp. NPDC006552 TaxID=3157179 RepID=UPI0033BEEBCC
MFPSNYTPNDGAEIKAHVQERRNRVEGKTSMGPFLALAAVLVIALALYVTLGR